MSLDFGLELMLISVVETGDKSRTFQSGMKEADNAIVRPSIWRSKTYITISHRRREPVIFVLPRCYESPSGSGIPEWFGFLIYTKASIVFLLALVLDTIDSTRSREYAYLVLRTPVS
ncbi:hypothetical protein EJ08DRAFT_2058 [Tothia fuscella]|uniref:Uncharacterized protein n=1 Tax=Tothia fuscella TaxID=1048955 RepID=A0A9P4U4A3_9PEZI|nr:hypothetical protein EJ08DRAFT_2058 [Tothia fuscella]